MMLIIWFEEKILYYSQHLTRLFEGMILMIIFVNCINGSRYSGMAQVKFVEDSLWKTICGRQFLQSSGIPNSLLITYLNYTMFGSRYSRMAQVKFVVCHITSNFWTISSTKFTWSILEYLVTASYILLLVTVGTSWKNLVNREKGNGLIVRGSKSLLHSMFYQIRYWCKEQMLTYFHSFSAKRSVIILILAIFL